MAVKRQRHFNRVWAEITGTLRPRFGFPFAADVIFLDRELSWAIVTTRIRQPVSNALLARTFPEQIRKVNRYDPVGPVTVRKRKTLVQARVERVHDYLKTGSSPW